MSLVTSGLAGSGWLLLGVIEKLGSGMTLDMNQRGMGFLGWLLPLRSEYNTYDRPKVLGVCHKIAWKNGWDLGLVRVVFFAGFLLSFGLIFLIYIAGWLFLPEPNDSEVYKVYYS